MTLAARDHRVDPAGRGACRTGRAGPWPGTCSTSTTCTCRPPAHVSVVCVPTALATGGGARAYLAAAGVMARLGHGAGLAALLGRVARHLHRRGAGRAAGAAVAFGLPAERIATAMALAVPAAGGVQRAFGTDAKSLQVGFAVEAGIRAARLAAAGRAGRPLRAGRVAGPGGRRPVRGGPLRTCGAERAGDQALPVLLRAAAADQRAVRAGCRRPGGGPPDRAAHPGGHGGAADPPPARTPGCRASSAWSTRPRPRCWTTTPGSAASPTRRCAGTRPGGWSARSRPSSTRAATGCSTASSRRRCTPPTGPCCGPASSTRRVPRPGRPRRTSCAAKLADCVPAWTLPTRDGDPGSWTWENAADTLRRR